MKVVSTIGRTCVLMLLAVLTFAVGSSAQTCNKANQYDMLEWMAPTQGVINGHFDSVFPTSGTFYWVKGKAGYPWDVDLFDANGIYQSTTENVWNDPHTFKRFETPRQWTPRCIDIPESPRVLSTIQHPTASTKYGIYTSCTTFTIHYLSNGLNQVVGPYMMTIGKLPPTPTLDLRWYYGCDTNYRNCHYHEDFYLQNTAKRGLVSWVYSIRQADGTYKVENTTIHDDPVKMAEIVPQHPCWP